MLVALAFWIQRRPLQYVLITPESLFTLVWFAVGLRHIADGLLWFDPTKTSLALKPNSQDARLVWRTTLAIEANL